MTKDHHLGRQVAGVTVLMGFLSLAGKLVGMVREMVVAEAFGAGAALDAFLVGFTLPDLLSFVALFVAVNLFVPVYLEVRERDPADADRFAAAFALRAGGLLVVMAAGVAWFAGPLVRFVAPDLPTPAHETAVLTLRLLAVIIVFRGLQGSFRGILNARRSFVLPMAASVSVSLVIIATILLFQDRIGVRALVLGTLVGNVVPVLLLFIVVLVSIPMLRKPRWNHPALALVRARLPWIVAIEAAGLAIPLVDRALASRALDAGMISALNFARILSDVPFQAIGLTLAIALFPELATFAARADTAGFRKLLGQGVRGVVAALVPVALIFIAVHEPVVRAVFERGAFDAEDTGLTASALWAYAIGLPFLGAAAILFQSAYAAGRHRMLLGIRFGCLAFKILVSIILMRSFGLVGLALATTAYHVLLVGVLAKPMAGGFRILVPKPFVLLGAGVGAAAMAWAVAWGAGLLGFTHGWGLILGQIVAWVSGGVVYLVLSRWGHLDEVRWAERMVLERWRPRGGVANGEEGRS